MDLLFVHKILRRDIPRWHGIAAPARTNSRNPIHCTSGSIVKTVIRILCNDSQASAQPLAIRQTIQIRYSRPRVYANQSSIRSDSFESCWFGLPWSVQLSTMTVKERGAQMVNVIGF